jgi:thiazole/oxazole-forming peptide maturase SagC family component
MNTEKQYSLGENTAIFFNGREEIVFRKGVWNYEEADLDISTFDEAAQEGILTMFQALSDGSVVKAGDLSQYGIDAGQHEQILSLLDELSQQAYLIDGSESQIQQLITNLIGGTASTGFAGDIADRAHTILICDSLPVIRQLTGVSQDISMDMEVMREEDIRRLAQANLTDRLDAIETEAAYVALSPLFAQCSSVLICLERPHIRLLRNINRILLKMGIPFVVCLLDGPFLSVMTIKGYETGCFECYETRIMARLESMTAYRRYVEKTSGQLRRSDKTSMAPILGMLSQMGLFEAFLINTIHKAKLAGRVFNIYLPLLEVQVQDLLRVPFCSACGQIAKARYEEMYTSSEKIVEELVDHVELSAQEH